MDSLLTLFSTLASLYSLSMREKQGGQAWLTLLQRMQLWNSQKYFCVCALLSPRKSKAISSQKQFITMQSFTFDAFYSQQSQRLTTVQVRSKMKALVLEEIQMKLGRLWSTYRVTGLMRPFRQIYISTPNIKWSRNSLSTSKLVLISRYNIGMLSPCTPLEFRLSLCIELPRERTGLSQSANSLSYSRLKLFKSYPSISPISITIKQKRQIFIISQCTRITALILLLMLEPTQPHPKKRQYHSITKSNTALNLPGISKLTVSPETERRNNNSSYLDALGTIGPSIEYEQRNTVYINKEQNRLKNILRRINEDAMHMIDIAKPKKHVQKSTKQQLNTLAEREINSSKKMIANLQYDIQLLKDQYVRIVHNHEEDSLIHKAKVIRQEIEDIRNENNGSKVSILRSGNEIVREYSDLMDIKLNNLENDNQLTNLKAERLRSDHSKAIEQIKRIQGKIKEAEPKIQQLQKEWNEVKSTNIQGESIKNRDMKYRQRKYNLQAIKKKLAYHSSQHQYRYYKLLKDLEYQNASCEAIDTKIEQLSVRVTNSKYELCSLDDQFREVKRRKREKGKMVEQYLSNEKKNKSTYIHEAPDTMPQLSPDKEGLSEILNGNQPERISKHWVSQQQYEQRAQEESNEHLQAGKQQKEIEKAHGIHYNDIGDTRSSKLSKNSPNAQDNPINSLPEQNNHI